MYNSYLGKYYNKCWHFVDTNFEHVFVADRKFPESGCSNESKRLLSTLESTNIVGEIRFQGVPY